MKGNQGTRTTTLLALTLILGLVLTACGGATTVSTTGSAGAQTGGDSSAANSQPLDAATQTNEEGPVAVAVTWQGPNAGLVFEVAMNTHSVELDGYDLMQLAVLRTDQGQEMKPSGWESAPGGHHRSGTLTFPDKAADGSPLIGPNTRTVELVIRNVADVPERVFRWTP